MSATMRTRARVVGGLTAGLLLAGGGVAWAVWTASGHAAATAATGSAVPVRGSGKPPAGTLLYPGAKTRMLIDVTNDNDFPVAVYQVRAETGPVVADPAHAAAGCHVTGVHLTRDSFNVFWNIAKKHTSQFQLSEAIKMTNESDNACQGATFTLSLTLLARSTDF